MKKFKYLPIGLLIFKFVKNWYDIPLLILGYKKKVYLKNGYIFEIVDYLNILQLIEIIFQGDYKTNRLSNPKTIIDIGANIGDSSVYFARNYPTASVLAFEPDKNIYSVLLRNIELNNVNNIKPFNLGVSDKNGERVFYSYNFSGLSGFNKLDKRSKKTRVKIISLNKVFSSNNLKIVDLLKLDCEGAEYDILLKTDRHKLKKVRKFVVEYHDEITIHSHKELIELFKNLKYKISIKKHKIEKNIGIIYATKNLG